MDTTFIIVLAAALNFVGFTVTAAAIWWTQRNERQSWWFNVTIFCFALLGVINALQWLTELV